MTDAAHPAAQQGGILLLVFRLVLAGNRCQRQHREEERDEDSINAVHGFYFSLCFWKNSHIRSLAETFLADLPMKPTGGCWPGQV